MNLKNIYCLFLGALSLSAVSCEDTNDWGVDAAYDRLFQSTKFDVVDELPTSVVITFNGVTNATKYVFEFSKGDSLLFNNIVRTEEALVDTMHSETESTNVVKCEYSKLFTELEGTTRYSVRMKAVDEINGKESGYSQLCFDTPDEQIFTTVTPGVSNVVLNWQHDKYATHIMYGKEVKADVDAGIEADTLWVDPAHQLTPEELEKAEYIIGGLEAGTSYVARIYNNDALRGTYGFRTLGSSKGTTIHLAVGDDLNAKLIGQTGDVTLVFNGGNIYSPFTDNAELVIPAGIDNLYLAGNMVAGQLPKLVLSKIVYEAPMQNFYVQYMNVEGNEDSQFLIEIGNENCPLNISFDGCYISKIPRSLIRLNSRDVEMEGIRVTNCILKDIALSGYGLLNIGKTKSLKSITLSKNTIWNMSDQIIDLRVQIDEFTFSNTTFYNHGVGMGKAFRLDKMPSVVTITSTLWSGDNGGSKMNAGNKDYGISYAGCYLTSDLQENNNKFTDAIKLDMSSDDLFVDPTQGDFHFKPEIKFEGDGVAGDPRWWTVR